MEVYKSFLKLFRQIDDANQAHAANYLSIALALMDKNIVTAEELESKRIQALSLVEQEFARKKDEYQQSVIKQYPELYNILKEALGEDYDLG